MTQTADQTSTRQPVASDAAWKGDELFERDDFLHELTDAEVDEVRSALARVEDAGLDLEAITPETFPLPTLSKRLATIQESLEHGSGAVLLRGWPAAEFDVALHSRSEFEDHADPELRRLILRIWLAVPNSRRLPPELAGTFGATEAGAIRGGIRPSDA